MVFHHLDCGKSFEPNVTAKRFAHYNFSSFFFFSGFTIHNETLPNSSDSDLTFVLKTHARYALDLIQIQIYCENYRKPNVPSVLGTLFLKWLQPFSLTYPRAVVPPSLFCPAIPLPGFLLSHAHIVHRHESAMSKEFQQLVTEAVKNAETHHGGEDVCEIPGASAQVRGITTYRLSFHVEIFLPFKLLRHD